MYKVLYADRDAYITNRVVNAVPQVSANVGQAGSLDVFKLFGYTSTLSGSASLPNTELSRLLVHFNLAPLRQMVSSSLIDPTNGTFSCKLHLFDVYGGQPTPSNFTLTVFPLSQSFDEGNGRDVVFYSDYDVCNFTSSSFASGSWFVSGCGLAGNDKTLCDYLTASAAVAGGASLEAKQLFVAGTEDLYVDVTLVVSATLAGLLPDAGFRIALDTPLETDTHSYFVKRFASRQAFNAELQPELVVRFDDSIQDDTDNLYLDSPSFLFLYNYVRSSPANLTSGSSLQQVTGSNCLLLQMVTPVSGGTYSAYFTGSQHAAGINRVTGIYSASVLLSSNDPRLLPQWQASGSITFTPIWGSLDNSVTYLTGSAIKVFPPHRGPFSNTSKTYSITILGLHDEHNSAEHIPLRINVFDYTQPYFLNAVRLPVELPGIVIRDVHYQVRDNDNGSIAVPFDTVTNSTRVSNDAAGMCFTLDASNLTVGHSYVIDVLIVTNNTQQLYRNVSDPFRVVVGQ